MLNLIPHCERKFRLHGIYLCTNFLYNEVAVDCLTCAESEEI